MSNSSREKLFEDYFESSYKHGNLLTPEQLEISSRMFERMYQGRLPENKEAAILDFGCGTGDFLFHLKKKGYQHFFGVDISPSQIQWCKEHISDKAAAIDGMSFLDDKVSHYDIIIAHDVMEHIPKQDMMRFLSLVHKALKKDGIFIARVPNMSNPFGLDARFNDFTHEIGFTSKSLYQIMWLAGFRDIEILPPLPVEVKSIRNFVRKYLVILLHQWLRFCFYIQDYTVPKNLDKNITVLSKKT